LAGGSPPAYWVARLLSGARELEEAASLLRAQLTAVEAESAKRLAADVCCELGCTTTDEMKARHGTPVEFEGACMRSLDITTVEAAEAIERYRRVYVTALRIELTSPNSCTPGESPPASANPPVVSGCGRPPNGAT